MFDVCTIIIFLLFCRFYFGLNMAFFWAFHWLIREKGRWGWKNLAFLLFCKSKYWVISWNFSRKKLLKYLVRMVKSSTFALAFGKEHGSNESKRSLRSFKRESSLNGWNTSKQGSTPAGFMNMTEGRQIQANRQSSIDWCTRSSSGRRTDKEKSPFGESENI